MKNLLNSDSFERATWRVQRVAWAAMFLFVVFCAAGLFGSAATGAVVRSASIYLFLLVIFRLSGKRALAQISTFDLVLVLIISEAIQQALLADDSSMSTALIAVVTLVGLDILLSVVKQRSKTLEKFLEGSPVLIMADGRFVKDCMEKERVGEDDVLEAARESHGIDSLDGIRYAVLERNGKISIVPKP